MEDKKTQKFIVLLYKRLSRLEERLEKIDITDYVYFSTGLKKRLLSNLLNGIARGVGSAIGVSFVFAILVVVLKWIAGINIPIISDFLFWLVNTVDKTG